MSMAGVCLGTYFSKAQNVPMPMITTRETMPMLIQPQSCPPWGMTFCMGPKGPLKPTCEVSLLKVTMYCWKKISPSSRMEPTSLSVPKSQVQMPLVKGRALAYWEGCMYICMPSKRKEKVGQLGVFEQRHSGGDRLLLQFWKKLATTLSNSCAFRQKQLVPESITAALAQLDVISIPPTMAPSTFTCQQVSPITFKLIVLFVSHWGIWLQYISDWLLLLIIWSAKAGLLISPYWQATSRKLGMLVYPMPTSPATCEGKPMPLSCFTHRNCAVIRMGVPVMDSISVPNVPATPEPSAYDTLPGEEVLVKVEESRVLKQGLTPASWVGSQRMLLPVSNCTPIVCMGVPTLRSMQQSRFWELPNCIVVPLLAKAMAADICPAEQLPVWIWRTFSSSARVLPIRRSRSRVVMEAFFIGFCGGA